MVYISIFKVLSFPPYPWLLVQNINLVEFFNVGLSKTSASIPLLSFASKALYQSLSASEDYTAKLDCTYGRYIVIIADVVGLFLYLFTGSCK